MPLNIGDRVYHKGCRGNGVIVTINNEMRRDKYGIKFFWKKYKKMTLHNLNGFLDSDMGIWASEEKLIPTPKPATSRNKVSMIGGRSLDKLIRNVCEIPRRRYGDGSDIVINYGNSKHKISLSTKVINRNLICNKFKQCSKMISMGVNVPAVTLFTSDDGYIQKPYYSMGGKNITEFHDGDLLLGYLQKKVNKVREFRAHVFAWGDDKVPIIQEKTVEDRSQLAWNKKQGAEFSVYHQPDLGIQGDNPSLIRQIKHLAHCATDALHYDIGGVDIALDDNNDLWVFEVNSRMGLRERSLVTYKKKFFELLNI